MQLFTHWANKENKTIIFIHHSTKNTTQSRGASAFVDAVRVVYELDKIKNKNGDILDDDSFMPQAEETKSKPFLDDSGNEIISTKDSKDKKPPKKTSKKKPVVDQD